MEETSSTAARTAHWQRVLQLISSIFVCLSITVPLVSCRTKPATPTIDTSYLTPPLPATWQAYHSGQPIRSELDAVIAARQALNASRLKPVHEPRVLAVESMTLDEAHHHLDQPGDSTDEDRSGDTRVWFILFDAHLQLFPPDPEHTITPALPYYGCMVVVLQASDGGRAWIHGSKCPPCQSGICLTPLPTLTPIPPTPTPGNRRLYPSLVYIGTIQPTVAPPAYP